jgi:hypothetical protein
VPQALLLGGLLELDHVSAEPDAEECVMARKRNALRKQRRVVRCTTVAGADGARRGMRGTSAGVRGKSFELGSGGRANARSLVNRRGWTSSGSLSASSASGSRSAQVETMWLCEEAEANESQLPSHSLSESQSADGSGGGHAGADVVRRGMPWTAGTRRPSVHAPRTYLSEYLREEGNFKT